MGKSDCRKGIASEIRKLTLPDGFQVGIMNLDKILKEVADLKLTDTGTIAGELLDRVKTCNFVASGAENDYASALFSEFQKKFGGNSNKNRVEPKKPHPG